MTELRRNIRLWHQPCYHLLVPISTQAEVQALAQLAHKHEVMGSILERSLFSSFTFPSYSLFFLVVLLSHAHTHVNKHTPTHTHAHAHAHPHHHHLTHTKDSPLTMHRTLHKITTTYIYTTTTTVQVATKEHHHIKPLSHMRHKLPLMIYIFHMHTFINNVCVCIKLCLWVSECIYYKNCVVVISIVHALCIYIHTILVMACLGRYYAGYTYYYNIRILHNIHCVQMCNRVWVDVEGDNI